MWKIYGAADERTPSYRVREKTEESNGREGCRTKEVQEVGGT